MSSLRKRVYGLIRGTFASQSEDENENAKGNLHRGSSAPASPEWPLPPSSSMQSPTTAAASDERSFIYHYLRGTLKRRAYPEIYYGKTGVDLPVLQLEPFSRQLCASQTGPDGGLTEVPPIHKQTLASIANMDDEFDVDTDSICSEGANDYGVLRSCDIPQTRDKSNGLLLANGQDDSRTLFDPTCLDWTCPTQRACGSSVSLYEFNPMVKKRAGDPVADVFAVVAKRNHCLLVLADGVNWGEKSRLAAQCAVRAATEHLQRAMLSGRKQAPKNTAELFHILLGAFNAGHQLILQEGGNLTTLSVAVVAKLYESDTWVLCSCNVGDSLCFVYSQEHGVREVTLGSHDIGENRDMRDAGGALGPVSGVNPELHNLTCAMTFVDPGDVVFITSDGVSDNFDPVVGKFCVIEQAEDKENEQNDTQSVTSQSHNSKSAGSSPATEKPIPLIKSPVIENGRSAKPPSCSTASKNHSINAAGHTKPWPMAQSLRLGGLPVVNAHQRHELMLLRMDDLLRHGLHEKSVLGACTAQTLVTNMIHFVQQLTTAKRRFLEDIDLYREERTANKTEKKRLRKHVRQKLMEMPGKLDHATVVAFNVGLWPGMSAAESVMSLLPESETMCALDAVLTPTIDRRDRIDSLADLSLEQRSTPSDDCLSSATPTFSTPCTPTAGGQSVNAHFILNSPEARANAECTINMRNHEMDNPWMQVSYPTPMAYCPPPEAMTASVRMIDEPSPRNSRLIEDPVTPRSSPVLNRVGLRDFQSLELDLGLPCNGCGVSPVEQLTSVQLDIEVAQVQHEVVETTIKDVMSEKMVVHSNITDVVWTRRMGNETKLTVFAPKDDDDAVPPDPAPSYSCASNSTVPIDNHTQSIIDCHESLRPMRQRNAINNSIKVSTVPVTSSYAPVLSPVGNYTNSKAHSEPPPLNLVSDQNGNTKKKKKHARGSVGRHTLGVDIQWIRKLVPSNKGRNGDDSPRSPAVQRKTVTPSHSNNSSALTPKWKSRLRLPWLQSNTINTDNDTNHPQTEQPQLNGDTKKTTNIDHKQLEHSQSDHTVNNEAMPVAVRVGVLQLQPVNLESLV